MRRTVAVALAAACLGLAACQPGGESEPVAAPTAPTAAPADPTATGPSVAPDGPVELVGEPGDGRSPALRIATLEGADYDLAEHRGTWVVVNFWATWCAPCLKEMPELSALDAMHEHIGVVGLAYEDIEPEAMRDFLDRHPVVYPIAIVDIYDPPADFDTPRGLPMTWLIAPDGAVARKVLGPVTAHQIEQLIAAAGGPTPEQSAPPAQPRA